MCDPFTLMLAGSAAIGAGGSLYAGARGSKAAQLQAEIARGNVEILRKQAEVQKGEAEIATKRGTFLQTRLQREGEATLGQQMAYFAANQIDPSVGSPLLLAGATAAQIETDAGLIRSQAALDAAGALARAAQTQAQASGQATASFQGYERAQDEMIAGVFGAATSLLKGGAYLWKGMPSGTGTKSGAFSGDAYSLFSI